MAGILDTIRTPSMGGARPENFPANAGQEVIDAASGAPPEAPALAQPGATQAKGSKPLPDLQLGIKPGKKPAATVPGFTPKESNFLKRLMAHLQGGAPVAPEAAPQPGLIQRMQSQYAATARPSPTMVPSQIPNSGALVRDPATGQVTSAVPGMNLR